MRRAALAALVAALVVTALHPTVQARGKALAALADAVGVTAPRPLAAAVERRLVTLDGVTGDLYAPGRRAPAVLLLPGAAPQGRDDPRVVRVAGALTRAGRVVFVPDLVLAQARFVAGDLDAVARSVAALAAAPGTTGRVAILGFSFGGSFGLVAAADPRARQHVDLVATFGSYADLTGVLQAATTGTSIVGERREPWRADPRAREVVREVAGELVAPPEREPLRAALRGAADPVTLPAGARAAYDLVTNEDPARTYALAGRLDPTGRELLARFSPASVAAELRVPVLALHSRDDPVVPHAELLRLARLLPHARTMTVDSFRHVDPVGEGGGLADRLALGRDVRTAWAFASRLLGAQERFRD